MDLPQKVLIPLRLVKSRIRNWIHKVAEQSQNPFWLLDRFWILAGVRFTPQNRSQRIIWNLYQGLTYSQFLIALVGFGSAIICQEDLITIIRTSMFLGTMMLCLAKQRLLQKNIDFFYRFQFYLETPIFSSGDTTLDETARKQWLRFARKLVITITVIILVQQILLWIPNQNQMEAFYIPAWIELYWGDNVSLFIHIWYISICSTIWVPKLYVCSITAIILMTGFNTEQSILVRKFDRITGCLHDLRQGYWDSELTRTQYWIHLRTSIRASLEQQQVLLGYLHEIQPMVEALFFLIYYTSLALFASELILTNLYRTPFMYIVGIGFACFCSLEIYAICYLVDSQKDIFETISDHMLYLCTRLPYSEDHHRDYIEMRTSLQIIALCSRNAVSFGCAGIADISVAVLAKMFNICYSVLTFLLEVI